MTDDENEAQVEAAAVVLREALSVGPPPMESA